MILAVILAAIILMQSKRSAGLGAVSGNSSDTYWSKNKGNSVEGALEKYTKIVCQFKEKPYFCKPIIITK